jgi:hypothetical protein
MSRSVSGLLVACLLLPGAALAAGAIGTTVGAGIVQGPDHAFEIQAPTGWTLDMQSGKRDGLWVVLYPTGASWGKSDAAMYANAAPKASEPTLRGLIEGDLRRQRAESPGLTVTAGEPLRLADGTSVPVNRLTGDKWKNFESIAYLEAPKVWLMLVLSAKSEAAHRRALPAFAELVRSYRSLPVQGAPTK